MDEVTFLEYLSYPFVQNALVAGVLISLCAALLGVPLVLRRLSFIGDGLSHVAFGAMAVAGVMNFADTMAISLLVTIAAAQLRHHQSAYLHLQHGEHQRRHDQRRDSTAAAAEEAERNRHPSNARPLRCRGKKAAEMIDGAKPHTGT